ncbi:MAG TPA: hypothetical protein VEL74_15310 [Thermoanaerobaculia bacterium]|nr:hypothetical protein [Thermoanaerobaculia bacterium]
MRGEPVAPSFLTAIAAAVLLLLAGSAGAADLSFLWSDEANSTPATRPAAEKAGSCDGIGDGIWNGCRGTGCHVCDEKLAGYDCYFVNHPDCIRNTTCAGQFYSCDSACPAPTAADRCAPTFNCNSYSNNPSLCLSMGCNLAPGFCAGNMDSHGNWCSDYWYQSACFFAGGSCWWLAGWCY